MGEPGIEDRLVYGFREGDHRCFAIVFHLFHRSVRSYAIAHTGNSTVAEDIVQDSFCKLWESHATLESIANISAFLYRATLEACAAYHRYNNWDRRGRRKLLRLLIEQEQSAQTNPNESEILARTFTAVQLLPALCREIVNLVYVAGMEEREVAATLNISIGAVKTERTRAIYLLKKLLIKGAFSHTDQQNTLLCFINRERLGVLILRCYAARTRQLSQQAGARIRTLRIQAVQLPEQLLRFAITTLLI